MKIKRLRLKLYRHKKTKDDAQDRIINRQKANISLSFLMDNNLRNVVPLDSGYNCQIACVRILNKKHRTEQNKNDSRRIT